jgi:general secretion pathway protein D
LMLNPNFILFVTILSTVSLCQVFAQENSNVTTIPYIDIPQQSEPETILSSPELGDNYNIGSDTNLVSLLRQIRELANGGDLEKAQALVQSALTNIGATEKNKFYLSQIRQQETKLYYELATKAMREKKFSLASQFLDRYRENVALELSERKRKREVVLNKEGPKDISLVGKLVKELDQAKKDLAEIRAKAGLPEDDSKPDLERLMEREQANVSSSMRQSERLLIKARKAGEDGRYDEADELLNEALSTLPEGYSTIAMISDLYKAKQQITWYKMGEAMLKGKVSEVQDLVVEYKRIEDNRREAETETLGIGPEVDYDAEIQKALEKNREQAKQAEYLLEQSRENIKKKNYDEAEADLLKIMNYLEPNTLTWPLILEASLVKNRINLSKAEDFRDKKDWEKANEYLDAFKLGFHQDKNIQGDTLSFGRPGLKETRGNRAAEKELDLADKLSERIEADKRDPYRRDITEFSPQWKDDNEKLDELLMRAKVQFVNNDLMGATETYRAIETRFSDNYEAKEMLRRISKIRQEESYLGYLKTRQEMLEEIDREWERPKVFDRVVEETADVKDVTSKSEDKLNLIQISPQPYFETPLPEVIMDLQRLAKQGDLTEPDPTKKGLLMYAKKPPDGEEFPKVTITLIPMSLGNAISVITESISWTYEIEPNAIVISKTGGSIQGRRLETEEYEITQGTVRRMTGGSGDGGGGGGAADPFAAGGGGMGGAGDGDDLKVRAYLEAAGITFDESKGHRFAFDGFLIIVTHDRRTLDKIERILARLDKDTSKQVEIETKFLEVQEGALDEISFDWQFGWSNPAYQVDPQTGNPVVDVRGNPMFTFDNTLQGNTRTLAQAHSPNTGQVSQIVISDSLNPQASFTLPTPAPVLPGFVDIGSGVSPLIQSSRDSLQFSGGTGSAILGGSQAQLLISALQRKQGTDLLSAPRITVVDGEEATITIAQEFIYPIQYEAPEPPQVNNNGGQGGGNAGGGVTVRSATPEFGDVAPEGKQQGFREVGVILFVRPKVEKYNSINLFLQPEVTEFDGFVEYGGPSAAINDTKTIVQPSGNLMPIFSTRKVETTVTIFDGATVVIGGLTREEVKTVNDKIPVLGNIPLLGRLFQSSAESYQKRNLLIFVSANIVSRGGSPVRETIQNISPQSIFKDPVIMTPTGTIRRSFKETVGTE